MTVISITIKHSIKFSISGGFSGGSYHGGGRSSCQGDYCPSSTVMWIITIGSMGTLTLLILSVCY
jgi:hypothetical protein